ncbi:hypothetical protein D3C77_675870 [compost metagenome]
MQVSQAQRLTASMQWMLGARHHTQPFFAQHIHLQPRLVLMPVPIIGNSPHDNIQFTGQQTGEQLIHMPDTHRHQYTGRTLLEQPQRMRHQQRGGRSQ